MDSQDIIVLVTYIAMELAKDKTIEEIKDLRDLINQISCSLNTLICMEIDKKDKKRKNIDGFHDGARKGPPLIRVEAENDLAHENRGAVQKEELNGSGEARSR